MENLGKETVKKSCFILSPEELARLGVFKIDPSLKPVSEKPDGTQENKNQLYFSPNTQLNTEKPSKSLLKIDTSLKLVPTKSDDTEKNKEQLYSALSSQLETQKPSTSKTNKYIFKLKSKDLLHHVIREETSRYNQSRKDTKTLKYTVNKSDKKTPSQSLKVSECSSLQAKLYANLNEKMVPNNEILKPKINDKSNTIVTHEILWPFDSTKQSIKVVKETDLPLRKPQEKCVKVPTNVGKSEQKSVTNKKMPLLKNSEEISNVKVLSNTVVKFRNDEIQKMISRPQKKVITAKVVKLLERTSKSTIGSFGLAGHSQNNYVEKDFIDFKISQKTSIEASTIENKSSDETSVILSDTEDILDEENCKGPSISTSKEIIKEVAHLRDSLNKILKTGDPSEKLQTIKSSEPIFGCSIIKPSEKKIKSINVADKKEHTEIETVICLDDSGDENTNHFDTSEIDYKNAIETTVSFIPDKKKSIEEVTIHRPIILKKKVLPNNLKKKIILPEAPLEDCKKNADLHAEMQDDPIASLINPIKSQPNLKVNPENRQNNFSRKTDSNENSQSSVTEIEYEIIDVGSAEPPKTDVVLLQNENSFKVGRKKKSTYLPNVNDPPRDLVLKKEKVIQAVKHLQEKSFMSLDITETSKVLSSLQDHEVLGQKKKITARSKKSLQEQKSKEVLSSNGKTKNKNREVELVEPEDEKSKNNSLKRKRSVTQTIYFESSDDESNINIGKRKRQSTPKAKYIEPLPSSDVELETIVEKPRNLKAVGMSKRGRGRPKKTTESADKLSLPKGISQSDSSSINIKGANNNDISPEQISEKSLVSHLNELPKKRGRRRPKSLDSSSSNISVKEEIKKVQIMESSQRGRKRKQVNYLLLDNPHLFEEDIKKQTDFESDSLGNNVAKDGQGNSGNLNSNSASSQDEITNCNVTNNSKTSLTTDSKADSSRYKWTGNTVRTMNQIFCSVQGKQINDSGHDPLIGKKKRRGRPKQDFDASLDKNGTSVCMVCKETINNNEWLNHKRKMHYNLTWRQGDPPLDINDDSFVLKTLTSLKQKIGHLKCNSCSKKVKKARIFLDHLEECNGVVSKSGSVTCAVCKTEMNKSAWQYHKYRKHSNLAWRDGENPLDLEDQGLVVRILTAIYRTRKPLYCDKCDEPKKSVIGFLSHKSICQKSIEELENVKIECEICKRKMLPSSYDHHMKIHNKPSSGPTTQISNYFDIDVNVGHKRKAAREALHVINKYNNDGMIIDESQYYVSRCNFQEDFVKDVLAKELSLNSIIKCQFENCNFEDSSVDGIIEHLISCPQKLSEYYVCKKCLLICKDEVGIHNHVKNEHNKYFKLDTDFEGDEESQDEPLENDEKERKRIIRSERFKSVNLGRTKTKPIFLINPWHNYKGFLFRNTYDWMLEFCKTNFNTLTLHNSVRNTHAWLLLDSDVLSDYLPKTQQSCKVTAKHASTAGSSNDTDNHIFKRLDLLEVSELCEGDKTIYCGGPVSSLAWLPTPLNAPKCSQILAVAVLNDMKSNYILNSNYFEPCVIQFWDFGLLQNHQENLPESSFLFGMALNVGPVWHLEWCPSGCYDSSEEQQTRLGLLALAASDSIVYIYSIDSIPEDERGLIYKGHPSLTLQLEMKTCSENQICYPTKISWSKASGHKYVAVGYTNGIVALYDLEKECPLLRKRNKSDDIILPYLTFQAHISTITVLSLSHLNNGNKWLLTSSLDRKVIFWDLSTLTKVTSIKKNTVSDGVWMTLWASCCFGEDETSVSQRANTHTTLKSPRDFLTETCNLSLASSTIRSMSFSDWLNTLIHGSATGEVMGVVLPQLVYNVEAKRVRKQRYLFSTTQLVETKTGTPLNTDAPMDFEDLMRDTGLVFLDNLEKSNYSRKSNSPMDCIELQSSKTNVYMMQSINKVIFNPNHQACSFYAAGYQAGFVRLTNLKFLSKELPKGLK